MDSEFEALRSCVGGSEAAEWTAGGEGSGASQRARGAQPRGQVQPLSGGESPWRAKRQIGVCVFNQGSYFEYV